MAERLCRRCIPVINQIQNFRKPCTVHPDVAEFQVPFTGKVFPAVAASRRFLCVGRVVFLFLSGWIEVNRDFPIRYIEGPVKA